MRKISIMLLALPLVIAVSACGDPEAREEAQVEAATLEQPGFEDTAVTTDEALSEATTLAGHLAAGGMGSAEAAVVLEDLDRLVMANIVEFPEDIRTSLTEDIQSARDALGSNDMPALQEVGTRMQDTLLNAQDQEAVPAYAG
ncbi:hypothetical protein [Aurantiacibacter suaedae]|uniref:hypothetical protein n=1 Tax=Aurantiacibacter suaedae TaxID=2545755 RepID=UPI0010F562BE|nr:hypothetical protein [Aurantiacibacter suaedae]